jgi:peroxiredoxin
MSRRPLLAPLLAAAILFPGCSLGGDDEVRGGADDLPGPVPAGVSFVAPPEDGVPAPDFTARLVDGTSVTASELWEERPLVLVFTASWCERCAALHRDVARVVDGRHGAIALLGVVYDDDPEAEEYARDVGVAHPLASASERIWLNWAAREPPVVVLVSHGGTVLRGWPGDVDLDALGEQLDAQIEG